MKPLLSRGFTRFQTRNFGLCTDLTDTATRYPGTDLTLAYGIKCHSDPA
jgi:hypothetical protein